MFLKLPEIVTMCFLVLCFLPPPNPRKKRLILSIIFGKPSRTSGLVSSEVKVSVVSDSLQPYGLYSLWNSPGQNTGVGCYSFLLGIFPTQESNWDLLHCRRMLPVELPAMPKASLIVLEIVNCNWLIKDWWHSQTKKSPKLQTEEPIDEMCLTEVLSKYM